MATQARTPQQEALDRLMERSRKETQELRRQYGADWRDEAERIVRQMYDEETLRQMLKYLVEGRSDWDDDEADLADAE
jgi:hypothetical protein